MTPAAIRTTRKALGMTQGQAAHLLGVDARTWRRWECAEREMPVPVWRLLLLVEALPPAKRLLDRIAAESPPPR